MKITDKMRLDFLTRDAQSGLYGGTSDWKYLRGYLAQEYKHLKFDCVPRGNTPRQAIDAAIRARERNKI